MTAAAETQAAPAAETPPAAAGSTKKLLVVAVAAVVLLGGGGAAAWLFAPRLFGKAAAAAPKPEVAVKATVALAPVVVNLAGEGRRYVRAGVSVGLASPKDVKEIEEAKTQIADLVIAVLAGAEAETLLSPDGRSDVKDELLERIHGDLGLSKVVRLYFTEFVVQ
jgi:flagellar FliL protein